MWLIIASVLFGLSVLLALGEAWEEWMAEQQLQWLDKHPPKPGEPYLYKPAREWPYRIHSLEGLEWPSTGRYVLIFGAILLISLGVFDH